MAADRVDDVCAHRRRLGRRRTDQVAEKLAAAEAERHGRRVRFGIRLHLIVRETTAEAWADANRLISHLDDATIAAAQSALARHDSVGQQRMLKLHAGNRDALEISPNLWAGVGLVRERPSSATPDGRRPHGEYAELGIDTFICSGYPISKSLSVAELLFPTCLSITALNPLALSVRGEVIGNHLVPDFKVEAKS